MRASVAAPSSVACHKHGVEPVAHDDDVGGFDGDVRAAPHRDSDIRLRERRRVVDAVPYHRHAPAPLQVANDLGLFGWQYFRPDVVDAKLTGDALRRTAIIAGHEHRRDALALHLVHGGAGLRADLITERDQSQRLAIAADGHHGTPGQAVQLGQRGGNRHYEVMRRNQVISQHVPDMKGKQAFAGLENERSNGVITDAEYHSRRRVLLDQYVPAANRAQAEADFNAYDAEIVQADLLDFQPEAPFDAVLLDAPCSSTGTVRRHPDVLWTKTPADIDKLAGLQARLLAHAVTLVRPGGLIVFSNCSLDPREGEDLYRDFLANTPGVVHDPVDAGEIAGLAPFLTAQGTLRSTPAGMDLGAPGVCGLDGFFAARMRRAA